jgi:hypothetical protein
MQIKLTMKDLLDTPDKLLEYITLSASGINNQIIDLEGKYAMSENSIAIAVDNINDAEELCSFLIKINDVIKHSCLWSNFRLNWRLFLNFKKYFYKVSI